MTNLMKATDILSRDEIRRLRQKSSVRGAWLVFHAWAVIGIVMTLYAVWPVYLILIPGLFIIAGRQLGLAVLMHDAAHGLLFRSRRLNDTAGQWLAGAPVGGDLYAYRPYHIRHHRFTQQPNDPDLGLSRPFPITRLSLARKMLRDLIGWTFVRNKLFLLRVAWATGDGATGDGTTGDAGNADGPKWRKRAFRLWRTLGTLIAANIAMAGAFAAAGRIDLYLLLWLLPLVTTFQWVTRIRNISEHAMVPETAPETGDAMRNTRTTHAGWLERAILAPYWVNYHIEHHLWIWVPCFRLREGHRLLREKGFAEKMETRDGYASVLKLAASS